jgi:hypothetical protein
LEEQKAKGKKVTPIKKKMKFLTQFPNLTGTHWLVLRKKDLTHDAKYLPCDSPEGPASVHPWTIY